MHDCMCFSAAWKVTKRACKSCSSMYLNPEYLHISYCGTLIWKNAESMGDLASQTQTNFWGNLLLHAHFTIVCRSWLMHFCTYVFTLDWTAIFHPHFVYWDLTAHVCTWFYMLSRGFSIPIPLDVSHVFKYEVTCVYSMLYQVLASHWTSPMWYLATLCKM